MDRNTFTGLFLILVILVGSTFLLKPSTEEINKEKLVQDSIAQSKNGKPKTAQKPPIAPSVISPNDTAAKATLIQTEELTVLENDVVKVSITNVGGKISSVEL